MPSPDPQGSVEASGVTKIHGEGAAAVTALAGVDLRIAKGEFVAAMGPSGSGKSTLLHLLGGLDRPTSGHIVVDGRPLDELDDDALTLLRRRRIGLVFQAFNLLDVLTAEENVAVPLVVDGVAEAEAQRLAIEALDQVGLAHRRDHRPKQLSGGEQQRVAIARALVHGPALVLADEPTGNLDSINGQRVMELLRRLASERSQTIFMATHSPEHAAMADRIVVLRDGRIVEEHSGGGLARALEARG